MRAYPTVKDTPNRKSRKALRKKIFEENKLDGNTRRKARKALKEGFNEKT